MKKTKPCRCDGQCLVVGNAEETIKYFFASHPFILGLLVGYSVKENPEKLVELLKGIVKENYNNPRGWGRR